jgi:iron complex transport system ATP-binding protein
MSHRLATDSVSFAYVPTYQVLEDVSVTVAPGDCTGIVGPNGSGKSTLLRLLAGMLRPDAGAATLDGEAVAEVSHRRRAQSIAFLPQAVQPTFSLTVFETVCLGRHPHLGALGALTPHDREVAGQCLDATGSAYLRNRDFMSLSGGERQRVMLASILAQEPALLLLDEPTSALDVHHQVEIFDLLRRLAKDGYGVCVVTHDLNLAARFCRNVLLLSGQSPNTVAYGTPDDVFTERNLTNAYGAPIQVSEHPIDRTPLISASPQSDRTP